MDKRKTYKVESSQEYERSLSGKSLSIKSSASENAGAPNANLDDLHLKIQTIRIGIGALSGKIRDMQEIVSTAHSYLFAYAGNDKTIKPYDEAEDSVVGQTSSTGKVNDINNCLLGLEEDIEDNASAVNGLSSRIDMIVQALGIKL